MWFRLKGDERITHHCVSEGCCGQPTWRLEADGVGAYYCSGCKEKIVQAADSAHCRAIFSENVKYGGMP